MKSVQIRRSKNGGGVVVKASEGGKTVELGEVWPDAMVTVKGLPVALNHDIEAAGVELILVTHGVDRDQINAVLGVLKGRQRVEQRTEELKKLGAILGKADR